MLPRLRSNVTEGKLGIARPLQARLMVWNADYVAAISDEIGEWWWRVVDRAEKASSSDWLRVERSHLEDACTELMDVVRALPLPVREVLVARASGSSWRTISRQMPHRVYMSLADDHERGLQTVWDRSSDLVRRIG